MINNSIGSGARWRVAPQWVLTIAGHVVASTKLTLHKFMFWKPLRAALKSVTFRFALAWRALAAWIAEESPGS